MCWCLSNIELKNTRWNIEIRREGLCVTLVIYQESLHDARSTKYKMPEKCNNAITCQIYEKGSKVEMYSWM